MDQPTAHEALRRLEPLVGEWSATATWRGDEPWSGEARMVVEWHESGAHLVQRSTIEMPQAPDSVSIIGCDGANGTYWQLYSDERGVCRVFEMAIDEREWRLWRSGAPFDQRFSGRFEAGGRRIAGRWERTDAGAWIVDFDLVYTRVG